MKKSRVLIIIPAYNEEENILDVYKGIQNAKESDMFTYDTIIINDGSTDATKAICKENKIPCINLIHNLGIGGAVQTGYKYAYDNDYDIAVQFDGDGQHEVLSIVDVIQPIINDEADFVIGSRFIDKTKDNFQSSTARRAGIRLISWMIKLVTGKRIYDTTSGFRAGNKKVIEIFAQKYPVEYPEPITTTELLKKKYRIKEVFAQMHERTGGTSSIHTWKNVYYMVNIILSIFIVGIRGDK